jgi:hypothetical protein
VPPSRRHGGPPRSSSAMLEAKKTAIPLVSLPVLSSLLFTCANTPAQTGDCHALRVPGAIWEAPAWTEGWDEERTAPQRKVHGMFRLHHVIMLQSGMLGMDRTDPRLDRRLSRSFKLRVL